MITESLVNKSQGLLTLTNEVSDPTYRYKMFNDGSTEVEVAEFLYSLVRLTKPLEILETGTYKGVSSLYMAQGVIDNGFGKLTTLEIDLTVLNEAKKLWDACGVSSVINSLLQRSTDVQDNLQYDLAFLDTEPGIRFEELKMFYPHVKEGGFILIHDLHPHLGLSNVENNGMMNWPYGDFRPFFGDLIKDGSLVTVNFRSPRGFTLFYKVNKTEDSAYKHLQGLL